MPSQPIDTKESFQLDEALEILIASLNPNKEQAIQDLKKLLAKPFPPIKSHDFQIFVNENRNVIDAKMDNALFLGKVLDRLTPNDIVRLELIKQQTKLISDFLINNFQGTFTQILATKGNEQELRRILAAQDKLITNNAKNLENGFQDLVNNLIGQSSPGPEKILMQDLAQSLAKLTPDQHKVFIRETLSEFKNFEVKTKLQNGDIAYLKGILVSSIGNVLSKGLKEASPESYKIVRKLIIKKAPEFKPYFTDLASTSHWQPRALVLSAIAAAIAIPLAASYSPDRKPQKTNSKPSSCIYKYQGESEQIDEQICLEYLNFDGHSTSLQEACESQEFSHQSGKGSWFNDKPCPSDEGTTCYIGSRQSVGTPLIKVKFYQETNASECQELLESIKDSELLKMENEKSSP